MRKEVFIAIIIGFTFGVVVIYGIHTAKKSLSQTHTSPTTALTTSPTVIPPNHSLIINAPASNTIVFEREVQITGITSPHSLLSLISNSDTTVAYADEQGNFSGDMPLVLGANQIKITSYHESGEETSQDIVVVYSDTSLDAPLATESANINPADES